MSVISFSLHKLHAAFLIFVLVSSILIFAEAATTSATSKLEFNAQNISSNLRDWNTDLAIMFYAPWCKYCKQLSPSWNQISELISKDFKDIAVGMFDCELDKTNIEVCQAIGIDRYPSIYYIGYQSFNQAPKKGNIFGKSENGRIAQYRADIYPEALYDWIKMLVGISALQRRWDDFIGFFTGKSRLAVRAAKLEAKIEKLAERVELFGGELEKYKADELFDSLKDKGDPYALMSTLELDEKSLPLRVCVAEMVEEYCKYHPEESQCTYAKSCAKENMKPKVCRPEKCPFSKRGCTVASTCMDAEVLEQYKKALKV